MFIIFDHIWNFIMLNEIGTVNVLSLTVGIKEITNRIIYS